jgi:hypothetical protein
MVHSMGDEATADIARDMFHRGIQPDEEDEARLARSRWLEENRAEYSFPCGVVPLPEPGPQEPQLNVLPMMRRQVASVVAAVLPTELVFVIEAEEGENVEEVGRLPRTAIQDVDVVDERGHHVPEPIHETIEPSQLVFMVLRWSNEGTPDEDRFAFRSPWMAWTAARRLMEARRG